MNYQYHYDNLIEKYGAWEKPKGVYSERHRKLPGYLGGRYVKGNAFYVPARVHYLAHLLWAKITNHQKAWRAVSGMGSRLGANKSKMYEAARAHASVIQSEMVKGEKNPMYGRTHSLSVRNRLREARVGFKFDENARKSMSISQLGRKHSEETKRKIGLKSAGKTASKEAKEKMSVAKKGIKLAKEHAEKVKKTLSTCGNITSAQRWKCNMCELITTPGALANHQKGSSHAGKTKVV